MELEFGTDRVSPQPQERPQAARPSAFAGHSAAWPLEEARSLGRAVALSEEMRGVFDTLARLAKTEVTVTLVGETGTGKDVLAHVLHQQSARARRPFVVFDCGSVAPNLAESELLGHERGAFTGAITAHTGAFERAHGGTLFLDEIGELPIDLQPRLLRVLENRSVRRVGGTQDRAVDVRVIAATNRNLRAEVASGTFRADLFFRLAGAVVQVPALRHRLDDLPVLVPTLLSDLGLGNVAVLAETYEALRTYDWPGNVRELKNVLACSIAFSDGGALEPRHLRLAKPDGGDSGLDRLPLGGKPLRLLEQAAIRQTLSQTGGNKVVAARLLGIAVSTLYEKLKKRQA